MTAEDALSRYFVEQGLFPEGSSVADWIGDRWYRIGGIPVLPLVGKIKESLILHDLHHLVTGYDTSWKGELELAGWELGSGGCGSHFFFWFDRLGAFALGLLMAPRSTLRALRRGRRERNLYRRRSADVLGKEVAELQHLVLGRAPRS
jgi:hypothetical protein